MPRRSPCHRLSAVRGRVRFLAVALLLATAVPPAAWAEVTPPGAGLSDRLNAAAVDGPSALLRALSQELANNPDLAATPGSAAAVARAAAAPVSDFVGTNVPVLNEIARQITAAAPAEQRAAVRQAVDGVLGNYAELDLRITPPVRPDTMKAEGYRGSAIGEGYPIGSFTLYPDVQAGGYYDDNIYATSHGHVPDWVGTVSPRIAIQSDWERHSLYAEAQTDVTNYWSHPHENTVDWHVLAEGEIDVTDRTQILLGAIALRSHEDRSSPDAVEGFEPTPYNELNGYAGVEHRFDDFTVRIGSAVERITFGNVMGANGEIYNEDRNRNRYTVGGMVRYERNPNLRPFLQVMGDFRRYDTTPDDFGYDRNSDGFVAGLGLAFRPAPKLSGEVFLGALHRSYSDPAFKPITTPAMDAVLRWQVTPTTATVAFAERSIEETTLPGSPGYIYTLAGVRLEQVLAERLTGIVRFAFAHSDFTQIGRNDNSIDTSLGFRYRLTQIVTLGVDYRYSQRVSGNTLNDFTRNQVFFRVGADF